MIRSRTILKGWFERGDQPREEHFWDWIDSFWHKEDDAIPISAVSGLQDALDNAGGGGDSRVTVTTLNITGTGTFTALAERAIEGLYITPGFTGDLLVGTTPGGSDIIALPVSSGVPDFVTLNSFFNTQTTIYFTGTFTGKVKTTSYA